MGCRQVFPLDSVDEKGFDLIYGSHSLEHVLDLDKTMKIFDKILKPGGLIFMEVPNCHQDCKSGYPDDKLDPPHTYYFTRKYFDSLAGFKVILNKTFYESKTGPYMVSNGDDGEVIRFLARKIK